jgi:thiamine pyrophosphate-dependent acetolactate synthase large subunit-like protein
MLVSDAIGEALQRLGAKAMFGLMGDGNMRIISHATETLGLAYYGARHESGAVAMADGYSRVSDAVGVCTVTQGPGVTNALTALTEAVKAGSRVLLVAGATPTRAQGHNQAIDQDALFAATGAAVQPVRSASSIVQDLVMAWNTANLEQRPVAVSIPTDIQNQVYDGEKDVRPQLLPRQEPEDIEALCELIARSERPLIIAGRGAVRSGARPALEALGERIGALLATSVQAKGFFTASRFDAGISGGFASPAARRLIGQADLILAFGTSLPIWATKNRELFAASARIVQVDTRPAAIGARTRVDHGVVGDAAATAEALLGRVERKTGFRAHIDSLREKEEFEDRSNTSTMDPRALMLALDKMLPAQRTVIVDSGHSMGWSTQYLSVPDGHGFIFGNDFMVVGLGIATAFGAAIARPERLTVCAPGDGGLMMSAGELETLVRYRVPMLVLAMNDAAFGVEVHILRQSGRSPRHAQFTDVDFAAVGRALGAEGMTVRRVADLEPLRAWLAAPRGPMVVDCKLNPEILGDWFRENITPGSWMHRMTH